MLKYVKITILFVLVLALSACIACGGGEKQANKTDTLASSEVVSGTVLSPDSVEIAYNIYGSGDHVLVLVHCWSCDSRYWDAQVEAFKDKYKIVTLDLAGHGESGMNREKWDMPHYGADVDAVVKTLPSTDNVILVGHSMGGAVCIEAARQLPGRYTAIIGVDTFQDMAVKYDDVQVEMYLKPLREDFPATSAQFVRSLFGENSDSALVDWVVEDMSSAPEDVAVNSMYELLQYDAIAALKEMRVPIRAINADRFPTNAEGNDTLASSFKVTLVPNVGHFVHMEDNETFDKDLQQVLLEFWPEH